MPMESEAQRRLMYAVHEGRSSAVPKDVADRFVAHDQGGKLPERKRKIGAKGVKRRRKIGARKS